MSGDDPCSEMRLLIQAELDNELDAAGAASLAGHMAACPGCARMRGDLAELSARLRADLPRHAAPESLRRSVLAQVRAAEPRRLPWAHGGSFGAGMALAAGLAALVVLPMRGGAPLPDVVAAHIRALQPGHLVDVASSDQHTVKPWFDGRLDFAPPVQDFAAQGFPLVGGRLDYLDGRAVAALIYRRDRHLVDVFIWPADRRAAAGAAQGYNVVSWTQGGMAFQAVSDLSREEMTELARLIGAGAS